MYDPNETLIVSKGGTQTVEVYLFREDGVAEDVSGASGAVLKLTSAADGSGTPLVTATSTGTLAGGAGFTFSVTAAALTAVAAGVYWGFVTVTIGGVAYALVKPFRVEVTPTA